MELVEITLAGVPTPTLDVVPEIAVQVMERVARWYREIGYHPPWIAYLATDAGACVGACAFKTPPANERVEIAYFTFPGNEGRGVATAMAGGLIARARTANPTVRVFAQTLPESSASIRVLEKLGFAQTTEIDHPDDGRVWEWELIEQS